MDQQTATKLIAEKVAAAKALISEAEALADQSGVSFYFSVHYGAGATYKPADPNWEASSCEWEQSKPEGGWTSSSSQC